MSLFLGTALAAAADGHAVLPLAPNDKRPLTKWIYGHDGQRATNDPAAIMRWARRWPDANVGIALRVEQVVLDADSPEAFAWCAAELPATRVVSTGRDGGGQHWWFRWDGPALRQRPEGKLGVPGLGVKTLGGFVVAPGSVHPSGLVYRVLTDVPTAELPGWLAERIQTAADRVTIEEVGDDLAAEWAARGAALEPWERAQAAIDLHDRLAWLESDLRPGVSWGSVCFAQAARLGRQVVGTGAIGLQEAADAMLAVFQRCNDGEHSEAHAERSVWRGLVAGATEEETP